MTLGSIGRAFHLVREVGDKRVPELNPELYTYPPFREERTVQDLHRPDG
jgi:hypothetical protein